MQVVGLLGILRLDLECLLQRLRPDQLLKSFGCLFKPRLRVVDDLGRDRLEAFVKLGVRANCRIKIVFANLLELFARLLYRLKHAVILSGWVQWIAGIYCSAQELSSSSLCTAQWPKGRGLRRP